MFGYLKLKNKCILKNIEKKNYFEESKLQVYFFRQSMKKLFNFDFIF